MNRDAQLVIGVGVFVVLIGALAAGIVVNYESRNIVEEPLWFRFTSSDNETNVIASVYIYSDDGVYEEMLVYYRTSEWQRTSKSFDVNDILTVLINMWDFPGSILIKYKIGRGPVSLTHADVYIELVSYWEEPDY